MPSQVFISYSHKDEAWKDRLVSQLSVLEIEDRLELWEDRRIATGDDWRTEIKEALEAAKVAVLLVTANFLTSEFVRREEVPRLLYRRRTEGIHVVPVIAKPCAWDRVEWLAAMQCWPEDGKPLSRMRRALAEEAMSELARKIDDLLTVPDDPPDQTEPSRPEPAGATPREPPPADATAAGEKKRWTRSRRLAVILTAGIVVAASLAVAGWLQGKRPPVCEAFSATPEAAQRGATVSLAWETRRAHSAFIPDVGTVLPVPNGSVEVQPAQNKTYHLHLSGRGGVAMCQAAVTVEDPLPAPPPPAVEDRQPTETTPPPATDETAPTPPIPPPPSPSPPRCVAFRADPETVVSEGTTTLRWETSAAAKAIIDPEIGPVLPSGSLQVSPAESTVYTLTVSNQEDSASCQAEVEVVECIVVAIDGEDKLHRLLLLPESTRARALDECRRFRRSGEVPASSFNHLVCRCEPVGSE